MKKITLKGLFAFAVFATAFNAQAQHKSSAQLHGSHTHLELSEENQRSLAETGFVRCASVEMHDRHVQQNAAMQMDQMEEWLQPLVAAKKAQMRADIAAGRTVSAVVDIPIIFHVITSGSGATNLSAAQIQAQIDQLNLDFNNQSGSGYAQAYSADINFIPAVVDPSGNPLAEPGIDRVTTFGAGPFPTSDFDQGDGGLEIKPQTIWDRSKYANIWTADISGGILGYAQFPSNSTLPGFPANGGSALNDGVVIGYGTAGSVANPGSAAPYNLGRTLTHEIGHWIGLRHIWGDTACGGNGDYCDDTPDSDAANYGTAAATSCGTPDMVENYMDYTDDAIMDTFTFDQVARIITVLENADGISDLPDSTTGSASPIISFANPTVNEVEGTSCNFRDVDVDVAIANAASANATVTFVKSGTATDTVDYDLITPSATFSAGATASQTLTVRIYEDGFAESNETIVIDMNLSTSGDAELATNGTETLTLTLTNDDASPVGGTLTTLFEDSFESYTDFAISNVGGWTLVDGDGDATYGSDNTDFPNESYTGSFIVFNAPNTTPASNAAWNARTGNKGFYCFNSNGSVSGTPENDDYAFTPQVSNGTNGEIKFYAQSLTDNYAGGERFRVGVSSNNDGTGITYVTGAGYVTPPVGSWTEYTYAIPPSFDNQDLYVVIHVVSADEFVFMMDDISVTSYITPGVQTATNAATAETFTVDGTGTAYAYDASSNDIMMSIQNNDSFDYGCANVTVSRAGTGSTLFAGTTELVTDKVFTITSANNARTSGRAGSGDLTNTFYFTPAEIAGWEASPLHDSNAMYIYRVVGGVIEDGVPATKGSFGSDITLQGAFTSLEGDYYFGRQQILAVEDNQFDVFGVYPNPSNGEVSISLSTNKDVQVSLFDIRGRQVYGKVFNNTSDSFNERVDFNAMSSGVYMLEVQSGSKRAIKKLVIQ